MPKSLKLKKSESYKAVHFVGIGGIGMSSLASWFLAQNWAVSGSDIQDSQILKDLAKKGAKIKIGHKSSNIPENASLLVRSAAILAKNPEIKEAKARNMEILTYAEALGRVMNDYKTIAIAGAHGKSTTTAMVANILEEAGFDPTLILGSKIDGSNFRSGKSDYLIVEADEYDGSFWNYHPWAALVTNIDLEHLDFYKDLGDIKKSFIKFLNQVDKDGFVVLNKDNENIVSIYPSLKSSHVAWYSLKDRRRTKIKDLLKVPGKHNVSNALGAMTLALNLGIDEKTVFKALSEFTGIWRRLEYRGEAKSGFKIFDDYAHHPTEIKASLQALKEKFPNSNLVCVFQPHQAKRLEALFNDFSKAFNTADHLILLDVYQVAGREEVSQNITSEDLAAAVANQNRIKDVSYLPDCPETADILKITLEEIKEAKKDNVVVMMGAGNIFTLTDKLLK
ncbi:MAG: UDP-N-acetylmuramate--L-alanine ligase [Patescibacteria group bacterium]|nr:UDP-N-acetylmuramate--L-alanine ligase [Patescibacteria group bacterium]MCL5261763.1 UDP-N-acetylmuramate--L-alanine ligase [Patescibacteria group bacterium]